MKNPECSVECWKTDASTVVSTSLPPLDMGRCEGCGLELLLLKHLDISCNFPVIPDVCVCVCVCVCVD